MPLSVRASSDRPSLGSRPRRLKEDLLHTVIAQNNDHELGMFAFLYGTCADGVSRRGFLSDGHGLRKFLPEGSQCYDVVPFFFIKFVQGPCHLAARSPPRENVDNVF